MEEGQDFRKAEFRKISRKKGKRKSGKMGNSLFEKYEFIKKTKKNKNVFI